jgi:CheY-like chemotaxis protein
MPTILCIDDDERALFIRTRILEHLKYRVLTATSAKEGLSIFSHEDVDAIVLDFYMPDMSGAEVAWELKRRGSAVPILMLSSAVFCPDEASDVVDAFCAKIDGPANFLEVLEQLVASAEKRGGASTHSILHVDDNEAQRYAIGRMLRRAGFKVLEAATGAEALAQVTKQPDLILLDVRLPDIDGFEVCRRIKADPATARIPVLHLTAAAGFAGRQAEGAAAGGDGYLVQPLPPEELISAVNALLERKGCS